MSGHSKWANIRVKKTAQDAKRGKVFTRHARLVEISARQGGADPGSNAALRTAIENAREDSVPNANIERAIKKGLGDLKGEQMAEVVYEAYGPQGTAYIIECLTDNRNRTIANVKNLITKHGGRMAEGGAVGWMFDRKGLVIAEPSVTGQTMSDDLELALIDAGAEDITKDDGVLRIVCGMTQWSKVRDALKQQGYTILSAGLSYIPKQKVSITDEASAKKVSDFIDLIEEDDDVSEVHTNAEVVVGVAA
ncbi:MAG: YebC/PmpR family DNA-binding transcriptional regulator [Candidatus Peregrinibacteria bacterium]|nr:YebC/PmpR family DNA-binding transcriptional regulator [Candidatus Peregrinibacteria bacterium]